MPSYLNCIYSDLTAQRCFWIPGEFIQDMFCFRYSGGVIGLKVDDT